MTQLTQLVTHGVTSASVDTSIDEVIALMKQHHIRHLPVLRGRQPVGMVSEGDILRTVGGLLSEERIPPRDPTVPFAGPTRVEEIMSTEIVAFPPDEPIEAAAQVMLDKNIAAVLIVERDTLVGIVTETDYLRQVFAADSVIPQACKQQTVASVMSEHPQTAKPDDQVFAMLREMGNRFQHLPVVENGQLVGILSSHDIRQVLALDKIDQILNPSQSARLMEKYDAARIMNREMQTIAPTATLADAARRMLEHGVHALPVVKLDRLVGILTETDILRACVAAL